MMNYICKTLLIDTLNSYIKNLKLIHSKDPVTNTGSFYLIASSNVK